MVAKYMTKVIGTYDITKLLLTTNGRVDFKGLSCYKVILVVD